MINWNYFMEIENWSLSGLFIAFFAILSFNVLIKARRYQKFSFGFAVLLIYLAVGSPMENLTSFGLHSVNMLQQVVLLMVAPVFLIKSIPFGAFQKLKLKQNSVFLQPKKYFVSLWILLAIVMWGGHYLTAAILSSHTGTAICGISVPAGSVVSSIPSELIFAVMLIFGTLFLLPVLHPDKSKRMGAIQSVVYLFSACISCSLLGLSVAFSAANTPFAEALPVLSTFRNPVPMGMRADQEMAGMLMWVPGCVIYAIVSVEIIFHWYDDVPKLEVAEIQDEIMEETVGIEETVSV